MHARTMLEVSLKLGGHTIHHTSAVVARRGRLAHELREVAHLRRLVALVQAARVERDKRRRWSLGGGHDKTARRG